MKKLSMAVAVTGLILAGATAPQAMAADEPHPVTKECPGGNQYYGDADFTKFWECSNGVAYRFDCPAGLHWDLKLLTCNYPEQANRVEGDHLHN
ncbi:carbohydrate-binding module family 14 protein [Streptomyces sp. NBC_01565]|uniref:carbohydrate-binding module family 14 protein n=1 Tax=unclassified Streptomyces TaxID=2593676 RepID=UPI00224CC463|nr:carbohydrate-binding module family 14 protein [Streptomyces sp. NBC_01565]MCX4546988.1 carbohydrate-binding module family 14 protein [Streptomyces sp. NBC_01565]